MSTPLSRALSRAARVLFALLILFVLSLALLHTPLVQRGLAWFLSSQASRAIEGRVTVGDVAYRLWRGEAVLESVTAESDAMLPGLSYELRARRIEVRLRTTPLSITVRVESPELTLRSDARSRSSSGDDAGYASAEPLEPRLPSWLAGLKIADGRLRFESRGDELDVASIDLELEDSHEGYRGSLEVGGGAVAFRNARFELKRAELVALGGEDGAEIPRAHLQLDGARAEAKGIVERLRPLVSRFDVELSIEASLLGVLTSSSPMKGRISSRLVLSFGDKGSRVSGELEARELEIGQIGPIDVGAGLRFEDDVLAIAPFEVEGYRGTLDGAAELDFRRGGTQSVEVTFAHVSLERILDELAGEAAIASSLEGSVRARLQDWSLETLDGEAEFALTGLDGRHPRPASGSISVNAEDGIIAFRSRELDIGQAATRLDGTITPSDFRVNFRVEQLDLATLTGALPDSIPASTRGVIGFEGTASGDGLEPDALDIEARLLPSTFETGEELFDLRGWARISQGRLHVIDLALESRSGTGRLEAGGTIELESGRLKDVRLAGKEIRARFDPWAGLIERIDVELSGPLASPSGSLALDLAGTSIRGRELPAFSITARSNGETATGAARYAGGEFLTAELQLRRKYPIVVQLELDRAPLPEALSLWIGDGVPGPRVVASGHVSGRADLAPFSRVSFRGSVETLEAELRGVDLRAKAPFTFEGDLSHAAVSNLVVAGEKTALEVDGVLALGEDADHDLRVAGVLGLKELEAFAREARVDGEVDLDLRLEGEPGAPSLTGRAILQDGSFLRSPLEVREVHLLLEADDDRITLERLSGKLLGGTLAAEGALDFCAGQTASSALGGELRIDARELDLAPLLEGTEDVQDASLILSALAAVEMGGLHVRELEGTGTISKLLVRVAGKEVTAGPASLRLSDARLEFSPLRFEGEGIDLVTEAEVTLSPNLPWSFTARGDADLALANAFLPEAAASGSVRLDLDASGGRQREELQLTGSAELDGASFRVDQPPLVVSDVEARVVLDSHRMVLERLQGRLGGGTLRAEGFYAPFASGDGERVSIRSNATDVRLEYPEGLRSTTSAELAFQNEGRGYLLSGEVRLREAIYDRDVTVERELLSLLSREAAVIQRQRSFAERIRIDLHAESEDGLRVRNNLAHTSLTADLDATGTLAAPELRGRVNTRAGGTIFFGGRTYELELARVTLDGYPLSAPIVDVSAHTEVGGTPIRLEVTGRTDELSTNLRAPEDPSLSRADIVSLLVTGRTVTETKGEEVEALGEGLASYLGGGLADLTAGGLGEALPVSRVSVQPQLVGRETDPGVRFSVGQAVTEEFFLTYSIGLNDAEDQLWILDYDLPKRLMARVTRDGDNVYTTSLSQELFLGGEDDGAPETPSAPPTVRVSKLEGELPLPREELRQELVLEEGDDFDYWQARRGADAVRDRLREQGFLNARAEVRTTPDEPAARESVELLYRVEAGKPVLLTFEGDEPGSVIRRTIREGWDGLLPPPALADELAREVTWLLRSGGHYAAQVSSRVEEEDDRILALFQVARGPKGDLVLRFEGNEALSDEQLERALPDTSSPQFHERVFEKTEMLRERLRLLYTSRGYVDAEITAPNVILSESGSRLDLEVTFRVDEGEAQPVANLSFDGVSSMEESELRQSLALREGERFGLDLYLLDRRTLHTVYRREGFPEASVQGRIRRTEEGIGVEFLVDEGPRVHVGDIIIRGVDQGEESFIREELDISSGEPLRLGDLVVSERRLYDLELFQFADVRTSSPADSPVAIRDVIVEVQEKPWLLVDYGVRYSTEDRFEGSVDLRFPGVFGSSRQLQLTAFANARDQILRLNLQSPRFFGHDIDSNLYLSREDEESASSDTRTWSLSYQQGTELDSKIRAQWSYSFRRINTVGKVMSGPFAFDITTNRSILSASLIQDTRNDVTQPSRGHFWNTTIQFAPEELGSDLRFLKGFGQFFPFLELPGDLVWASSYRLGLATGFDQVLLEQDRFQAGGPNSVRGFELNQLGPPDPRTGTRIGGEAVLVINEELRFPLWKWLSGVAFFDAGNVYLEVSDFDPTDLRESTGLGLRFHLPVGLLRVDWARVLDPRPGEDPSRFHFSFGHAF